MSTSPSDAVPSPFDATHIHPEFGYLAPRMGFFRKLSLSLKAAAGGVLVGAVAMFFMTMEREEQALTMLATPALIVPEPAKPAQAAMPTRTAVTDIFAPVPFIPESIALPAAAPGTARAKSVSPPAVAPPAVASPTIAPPAVASPAVASPAVASPAVASAPTTTERSDIATPPAAPVVAAEPAPAPAPAAKAAAKPRKKIVREPPPEPEPRAAFAGPPRRFSLPIFGFGW